MKLCINCEKELNKKRGKYCNRECFLNHKRTVGNIGNQNNKEVRDKISKANTGNVGWNKNLTKETDERIRKGTERGLQTKKKQGCYIKSDLNSWITCQCINPQCNNIFNILKSDKRPKKYCSNRCAYDMQKGLPTWNKNLTKETDKRILNQSIKVTGNINIINSKLGDKNPMKRPETAEKCGKTAREGYQAGRLVPYTRTHEWRDNQSSRMTNGQALKARKANKNLKNTLPEQLIEQQLLLRKIPYEKNKYILGKFPDFIINDKIIIECDGNYWHNYPNGLLKDSFKDFTRRNAGYTNIRLWEHEIKKDASACGDYIENIWRCLKFQ